ncbi:MAG TPA: gamma-glutamylcyclotransferase family protein [Syntrophales bacterium]|nr:gamma-glutamylcyclotransferase family protein [Syntrophales bacterium]
MSKEKIFVYGTLRKGFPLHRYLADKARFVGAGTIRGALYDLGEYPGVVQSNKGEVKGELYELENASKYLRELDRIEEFDPENPENSLFIRSLTDVKLADKKTTKAWVYFLPSKPARARLILDGDYQRREKPAQVANK